MMRLAETGSTSLTFTGVIKAEVKVELEDEEKEKKLEMLMTLSMPNTSHEPPQTSKLTLTNLTMVEAW